MTLLSDAQISEALTGLSGWSRRDQLIEKEYRFATFADAVAFIVRLGFAAEAVDHHPDIAVHYKTVRLAYWTHSEGGITRKDVKGAAAADGLARPFLAQ